MSSPSTVDRRQFLKGLGTILGAGATAGMLSMTTLSSALAYSRYPINSVIKGKLFNAHQMKVLAHICQTIIPKTDTVGAADLDCHGFIDHQLTAVYSKQKQQLAIKLVDSIDELSKKHFSKSFSELLPKEQVTCLSNIENKSWGNDTLLNGFKELKYLNAFGYFTSEVGATQVLEYQPVPGGYIASMPVTSATKNYGSLAFY